MSPSSSLRVQLLTMVLVAIVASLGIFWWSSRDQRRVQIAGSGGPEGAGRRAVPTGQET